MNIQDDAKRTREGSAGWIIQRLSARLDRSISARLESFGLTQRQFAILMTAIESDGITQAELGQRFSMPPYAISRALDTLAERSLITRSEHPDSRRANTIRPTETALSMAPALLEMIREHNARFLAPLSKQDADTLHALLTRILKAPE